jgi:DNA polymerase-1
LSELSEEDRKELLEANQRLVDSDFHTLTARAVFGEEFEKADASERKKLRSRAKAVTFGIAYGAGPQLISSRTGISVSDARKLIDRYYETNPAVRMFMETCRNAVIRKPPFGIHGPGFTRSLSGRKRFYVLPKPGEISYADMEALIAGYQRAAQNHPIQAGNADVTKLATILFYDYLDKRGYNARIILWVHDELVVVCKEKDAEAVASILKDAMIDAAKRYLKRVPVTVSQCIDKKWKK